MKKKKSRHFVSRFYSHNSSFVHGGLAENGREAEAVFGQQEIHQKIMTLNFRDCHAKIRQVTKERGDIYRVVHNDHPLKYRGFLPLLETSIASSEVVHSTNSAF